MFSPTHSHLSLKILLSPTHTYSIFHIHSHILSLSPGWRRVIAWPPCCSTSCWPHEQDRSPSFTTSHSQVRYLSVCLPVCLSVCGEVVLNLAQPNTLSIDNISKTPVSSMWIMSHLNGPYETKFTGTNSCSSISWFVSASFKGVSHVCFWNTARDCTKGVCAANFWLSWWLNDKVWNSVLTSHVFDSSNSVK